MKKILTTVFSVVLALNANATVIPFDLIGTAGPGLRFGSEPAVASGGTGGEIGAGITFDDVALTLSISNVGWGSSQGFTDLSSTASLSHIHTTSANFGNDGTANFKLTGGVIFTLTRSSSAATGGTFTNAPLALSAAQATELQNGRYYINIHTTTNTGGELRGFLVPVPEPASVALLGAAGLMMLGLRRRN